MATVMSVDILHYTAAYSIIDEDGDVTPEVTADNGSSSLSLGSFDINR